MQPHQSTSNQTLPFAAPMSEPNRFLLYAIRRMGAHGLHDAYAAQAFLTVFGMAYRRPLVMLRAFMAETARSADKKILLSGCCCARMTWDEARLCEALATALDDPRGASLLLRQTMGSNAELGALCAAQAVAAAFADLGRPLA